MSAPPSTTTDLGAPALRGLLALAIPMVLSRATQSAVTFADTLQVKDLGESAITATATGGLNTFGLVIFAMGIAFIVQSFVAQMQGKGQRDATPRFALYGLGVAALSGLVGLALIPLIDPLLSATQFTPEVQGLMGDYMAIRFLSIGAMVGSEAIGNWYGGLGNTWMQMVASIITMVVNIFLNWMLIGGHLGAPAMGVEGAALASAIASWVGFGFLAVAFWRGWGNAPKRTGAWGLSSREFKRVLRFGVPHGINWFLEFAAFQIFINAVMSDLGTTPAAALNVVIAINSLSFMPAFGLSTAGAILSGQRIGAGDHARVGAQVKLTLACTMAWMGAVGILYLVAAAPLIRAFAPEGIDASAFIAVGTTMLLMSAGWQLFDAVAMTLAETLRSAGDTTWTAAARLILAWLVFVPSAFISVRVFDGGPVAAMLCLGGYLGLLAIALAWRFRSGAWKKIQMVEPDLTAAS